MLHREVAACRERETTLQVTGAKEVFVVTCIKGWPCSLLRLEQVQLAGQAGWEVAARVRKRGRMSCPLELLRVDEAPRHHG